MAGDASGKTLSLLDALDKSFTSSGSPDSSFLLKTPETPHGSQNGIQSQQSSITDYFEPGSSSKKNTTAELLRAAQARAAGVVSAGWFFTLCSAGDADKHVSATVDAGFLSSSLGPTPKRGGAGGFNLNYDQDTPLRVIDVGGPDQERRCGLSQ